MPRDNPSTKPEIPHQRYWRANLLLVGVLLAIWFVFSFLLSIVWVEALNEFQLGGFPLGFWIAQQGSIYVFILLILTYALMMGKLDRKFHPDSHR